MTTTEMMKIIRKLTQMSTTLELIGNSGQNLTSKTYTNYANELDTIVDEFSRMMPEKCFFLDDDG